VSPLVQIVVSVGCVIGLLAWAILRMGQRDLGNRLAALERRLNPAGAHRAAASSQSEPFSIENPVSTSANDPFFDPSINATAAQAVPDLIIHKVRDNGTPFPDLTSHRVTDSDTAAAPPNEQPN